MWEKYKISSFLDVRSGRSKPLPYTKSSCRQTKSAQTPPSWDFSPMGLHVVKAPSGREPF